MGKRAKNARREGEVWEVINRERKSRKRVNKGIGMEEWIECFMGLLGGMERRVVGRERKGRRGSGEG